MTDTKRAVKEILRAFVCDTEPLFDFDINWKSLYKSAEFHHIDGIIGYMDDRFCFCTDSDIKAKLKNSYMTSLLININQTQLFDDFSKKLCENNISAVVFKGYIIRSLYPVCELRTFSDIDMLIHSSDREKSHRLMKDLGYNVEVDYGSVYNYRKGVEYYELHDSLIDEDILKNSKTDSYFSNAWKHSHKTDSGIYEFDDDFHLMYLIAHIAKHIRYGGAGIRMYLDIAFFVKNKLASFDFEGFIATAKELGIEKLVTSVIYSSCSWFGVDLPKLISDYVSENFDDIGVFDDLLSYTIDRGLFGNAMSSSGKATVEMMKLDGKKHPRLSAFLRVVLPPFSLMKLKYRYLEKAPFLLPVAWVERVIRNFGKIKSKKRKIEDIVATDLDRLSSHQALLKSIGLSEY